MRRVAHPLKLNSQSNRETYLYYHLTFITQNDILGWVLKFKERVGSFIARWARRQRWNWNERTAKHLGAH